MEQTPISPSQPHYLRLSHLIHIQTAGLRVARMIGPGWPIRTLRGPRTKRTSPVLLVPKKPRPSSQRSGALTSAKPSLSMLPKHIRASEHAPEAAGSSVQDGASYAHARQNNSSKSHASSFKLVLKVAAITCMVILFVELAVFQIAFNQAQVHGSEVNKWLTLVNARGKYEMKPIEHAKSVVDRPDTAFVFLALNSYARQLKCEGAIESLRKIGGWQGKIFLLTNQEDCYNLEKMEANGLTDVTIVNVDIVQASSAYLRSSHRTSKQLKAEVFSYLPEEVKNVVLMDCDMLIGQPSCIKPFIEDVTSHWDNGYIRFTRHHDRVHTGIMVANREKSARALHAWSERLATLQDSMDHYAYERAWKKAREAGDDSMEVIKLGGNYEDFYRPDRPPSCFNHISHKRCHVYGRDKVRQFVSHFDLETYKGGVHYCESVLLLPVSYGWVSPPARCGKLETIV